MKGAKYRIYDDCNKCFWSPYFLTVEDANNYINDVFTDGEVVILTCSFNKNLVFDVILRRNRLHVVDMTVSAVYGCGGVRYDCSCSG